MSNSIEYIHCVIENGYNTCYIDSLFVAMFYNKSVINNVLNKYPDDTRFIYLQEYIKKKFIEPLNNHFSIGGDIMNHMRNHLHLCGWCENCDLTNQQDISKFYKFIIDSMSIDYIKFEKINNNNDKYSYNVPFISLIPTTNIHTIRELLINWIDNNIIKNNTYSYMLSNIPQYIVLHIDRFNHNTSNIDIMKHIMLFNVNNNEQQKLRWCINSIICFTNNNSDTSGHYYTILLSNDNKWILFDDIIIPSFKYININDINIQENIKLECVLLFYIFK